MGDGRTFITIASAKLAWEHYFGSYVAPVPAPNR